MAVGSDVMKVITQSSDPGGPGPIGALSLKRARHCCASLSLSCRCAVDERLSARWLAADPGRGPKSAISSCLASARKSAVSSVTLTHLDSEKSHCVIVFLRNSRSATLARGVAAGTGNRPRSVGARARARGGVGRRSLARDSRSRPAQLSALCPYEQRTHILSYSHMIGAETR